MLGVHVPEDFVLSLKQTDHPYSLPCTAWDCHVMSSSQLRLIDPVLLYRNDENARSVKQ